MQMQIKPWNIVFIVSYIVFATIRGIFEQRTKGGEKIVSRLVPTDRILIAVVGLGGFLLPAVYLFTPWLAFADYQISAWVPWFGTLVIIAALRLFWRSHADLGRNWSRTLEIYKEHQLVKHGVYRLIRHPMYAAIWLFSLAQGLLLQNWLAGWSAIVTFAVMYFGRTPREEQMMCEFFGQEYRDYIRHTGRVFPRIKVNNDN